MKIELDFTKGVQENANAYYEIAKKSRKKLAGIEKGSILLDAKIRSGAVAVKEKLGPVKKRERKWYEKFHWFFTSDGNLVVSGKDAQTNEVVVKKIMEKHDVYFHADIQGAAHTILKTEGKKPVATAKSEAATFAAVFSKAWQSQISAVDVYSARPDQVTKAAMSGESIGTGAFMVYGEREWFRKTALDFCIGFHKKGDEVSLFSGPQSAVEANCDFFLKLGFGQDSKGDAAKRIRAKFREKLGKESVPALDDIVALLPSGGISVLG